MHGHPLAGLLWEKGSHEKIIKAGFEKVLGWECLFVHKQQQLFLSVYVDDFKLAGKAGNLSPMWAKLNETLELDPPQKLHENIYLGCEQREVQIPQSLIQEKHEFFNRIMADSKTQPQSEPEIEQPKLTKKQAKKAKAAATVGACPLESVADEKPKVRGYEYRMVGAAEKCVDTHLALAKMNSSTLKPVGTPCMDDHVLAPKDYK